MGNSHPYKRWQHFTISILDVWNNFMKNLFTVKSSEYIDLLSKLHKSKPYNKIGKHFCFSDSAL